MRLGYSWHGFLGDNKIENGQSISSPDGNATYGWSIIYEGLRRGHRTFAMQNSRDYEATVRLGRDNFRAFSYGQRYEAFASLDMTNGIGFPDIDVLLLEWRFPIPGRNTIEDKGKPGYQSDLERQNRLIEYYAGRIPIIVWDLDHKLTADDELYLKKVTGKEPIIFETSAIPRTQIANRIRVEPPICIEALLQFTTRMADKNKKLTYIGSRYERDDIITKYIKPASDLWPCSVEFWGNWLNSINECRKLWPNISYNERVTVKDFRRIYGDSIACPLLAKQSYLDSGFITPRPWEALMFGTIPIGIKCAAGIEDYTLFSVDDGYEMIDVIDYLSGISYTERDQLRRKNIEKLEFMDVGYFYDEIENATSK